MSTGGAVIQSGSAGDHLTHEAKAEIRWYILYLVTLPGIALTVVAFLIGYFIRDIAERKAQIDFAKDAREQLDRLYKESREQTDKLNNDTLAQRASLSETSLHINDVQHRAKPTSDKLSAIEEKVNDFSRDSKVLEALRRAESLPDVLKKLIHDDPDLRSDLHKTLARSLQVTAVKYQVVAKSKPVSVYEIPTAPVIEGTLASVRILPNIDEVKNIVGAIIIPAGGQPSDFVWSLQALPTADGKRVEIHAHATKEGSANYVVYVLHYPDKSLVNTPAKEPEPKKPADKK